MKKILVIDDVDTNLKLIKAILYKHLPHDKVFLAKSGMEGLKIAREESPDAILLDIFMPEMNGYEVCIKLKSDKVTKNIPVLMVSAYGYDSKVRIEGLKAGADAFISKPFNLDEFVALVNVMLRIKSTEDLLRKQNKDLELTISKLKNAEKIQKENLNQINKYQKKLKKLNSELLLTEEKERKAIADYLHDGISQTLSIAHIKLTFLLNKKLNKRIKHIIAESSKLIESAISDSRLLTYDLSPPILYELGLIPAIKWKLNQVEEKTDITTIFTGSEEKLSIDNNHRILIYRIVCELLLNIIKHANANLITIEVVSDHKNHNIMVIDDGTGFDYKSVSGLRKPLGYGLFSITERLETINGKINIQSGKESGTTVTITIPI